MVTKNFYTTTILYYAFFLPGVVLHEVSYWLVAGILNVRAEGAIQMPQKQEIAELDLNFIKLPKNVPPFKLAVITLAPLVSGFLFVWIISNSVLNVTGFVTFLGSGELSDISAAISLLTATPDFWLWIYLLFAISNTMVPNLKDLRGARTLLRILLGIGVIAIILGLGNEVIVRTITGPVADALYLLSSTFIVIIAIDLFVTAVLGTIEAIIERLTGDSATFEKGKLIAMTRKDLLELKRKQAAKALQSGSRGQKTATIQSIYSLPLPIPGGPDKEAISQPQAQIIEPPVVARLASPVQDDRRGPDMISGSVTEKTPATPVYTEVKPSEESPIVINAKSTSDISKADEDDNEEDQVDEADEESESV